MQDLKKITTHIGYKEELLHWKIYLVHLNQDIGD